MANACAVSRAYSYNHLIVRMRLHCLIEVVCSIVCDSRSSFAQPTSFHFAMSISCHFPTFRFRIFT